MEKENSRRRHVYQIINTCNEVHHHYEMKSGVTQIRREAFVVVEKLPTRQKSSPKWKTTQISQTQHHSPQCFCRSLDIEYTPVAMHRRRRCCRTRTHAEAVF